ncbi:MAG: hypothetical protein WBG19_07305 [Thermoplasmata archaeon]
MSALDAPGSADSARISVSPSSTDWRSHGGLVKMVGFVTEGIGVIVSGLSLHFLLELVGGTGSLSIYTNLFDTLEAGVILAGLGVILIGLGYYLESLAR